VSLSAFDRVRMKGIEVFGKSFVEKIDISLFQKILYCSKMETKSLLDKMNVDVTSDKADFKDSDIYGTESFIYKERKEKIGLSSLSVLIYLGDIDYKIHKILLNKFLCSFIEQTYHKKVVNVIPRGETVVNDVFKLLINQITLKYSNLIYENIQKLLRERQNRKEIVKKMCYYVLKAYIKHLSLRYTKKYASKLLLKKKLKDWISSSNATKSLSTPDSSNSIEKQTLCIVLNDSIYSVLLRNSIEKSKLSQYNPVFLNFKGAIPQKLLKFNLCVFSVDKSSFKVVEDNFFMLNQILDTPQNLLKCLIRSKIN
jgi:hypothetical protein